MLGPSGSGKTTTLRVIAGFERPDAGRVELAGVDVTRIAAVGARRQHRLPGLRALPAHDACSRTSSTGCASRASAGASGARRRSEVLERVRLPQVGARRPAAALRRAAPARRARARDRQLPDGAPARRAARRARPEAAPGDAGLPQSAAARSRHHVRLRHARPGRGAHDERPPRRLQRGPHRADRDAGRRVRASARRSSSPASSASRTCSSATAGASRSVRRRST